MKALIGGEWRDGLFDYHRRPGEVRVEVLAWRTLEAVKGGYFVRRRSLRMLWNYGRELGAREVLRKVLSRSAESGRNEKWVSGGYARVLEAEDASGLAVGDTVAFLAPSHPPCLERLSLPRDLLRRVAQLPAELPSGGIAWIRSTSRAGPWAEVAGWTPDSGAALLPHRALHAATSVLESTDWSAARRLPTSDGPVRERSEAPETAAARWPNATLVGYGHYAKTVVLPNVRPFLRVDRIHELDPTQIPPGGEVGDPGWDTAPGPRNGDDYQVLLAAGYHHTHAPLAAEALRRGRWAVVEKPLATRRDDLDELLAALRSTPRLFACFQRRYLAFNEMALRDLVVAPGEAVSYHAVVYEVPLPPLHWYRWPNSGSRLLSNGCHWIDHFLYLNNWSEPRSWRVWEAEDGTVDVAVGLGNGAVFTMALTERGSPRLGLRDHVELRVADRTVVMDDGSRYRAEASDRVLRRKRVNKMESYRRMYREIGDRIAAGGEGDSLRSIEVSTSLVLELESELQAARAASTVALDSKRT